MKLHPTFIVLAAILVPFSTVSAEDKTGNHNAAVEAAVKPAEKWPGVIKSYIGVTRLGTRIPCLVTKDDVDYGTKKQRILLIGGLDGSRESVELIMNTLKWFHTSKEADGWRKKYALSAVPIGNPDGWATGKGPGNLSGGNPSKSYPPKGPFYSTKTDPEAAYLWRWISMHAADQVFVITKKQDQALARALATQNAIGVRGTNAQGLPAPTGVDQHKKLLQFIELIIQLQELTRQGRSIGTFRTEKEPKKKTPPKKHPTSGKARRELQRRIARTPILIAKQLSKKYGHNLNSVVYIPSLALIGRMRLGQLTGDASHLKDVERIVQPYFSGKKPSLGKRVSGSQLSGHLVFSELARISKDPAKRKRYIELAKQAADLGFDKDGKMKKAMPAHSEMSDAVFMGCPILVQVGKLTGEKKYYDMALRHMRFMLKLNLRKDGLHRHSPLDETAWGRGNGFPALGLALCLTDLPQDHPGYKEMLKAFQNHMAAMAKHQDYTGTWHQVVDHPESYRELTVTCMTTFAMIRGLRNGWLDEKKYTPIIERAWTAIKTRIAPDGTLVDVCTGTGKQKNLRAYYDRTAILGYDARGGAMSLMVSTEMAQWLQERGK